jgi:hypothetical protein
MSITLLHSLDTTLSCWVRTAGKEWGELQCVLRSWPITLPARSSLRATQLIPGSAHGTTLERDPPLLCSQSVQTAYILGQCRDGVRAPR